MPFAVSDTKVFLDIKSMIDTLPTKYLPRISGCLYTPYFSSWIGLCLCHAAPAPDCDSITDQGPQLALADYNFL